MIILWSRYRNRKCQNPGNYDYYVLCLKKERLCWKFLMLIKTKYTEYCPQNLAILHDDRIHGVILRLETYMAVFLIESFDRGGIINQRYYSISVIGCLTAFYKNLIAALNPYIYH